MVRNARCSSGRVELFSFVSFLLLPFISKRPFNELCTAFCFYLFLFFFLKAEPSRAAPFAVDKGHRSFVFERTVDLLANRGPPQQA